MGLARFWSFFYYLNYSTVNKIVRRVFRRRLPGLSAEIAFNAMLALFPAFLALIAAIGLLEESLQSSFEDLAVYLDVKDDSLQSTLRNLAAELRIFMPDSAWDLLSDVTNEIARTKSTSLLSLSFAATLWVSSTAIGSAMNALDQIHRIPPKRRRPFWQAKLVSLGLTLGSIVLLVIASFLILIGGSLVQFIADAVRSLPLVESEQGALLLLDTWRQLSLPFALATVAIAFALIYRFAPSRWRRRTPILPGAILAALSWVSISFLFRTYVDNFGNYNKVYGAIGAVIVLMLWLYLSSLVMLIGCQLNVTVGEAMRSKARRQALIAQLQTESTAPLTIVDPPLPPTSTGQRQ
ncbi:MAG: YihY/virulence factor BrkB family protein [Spirulinaceae cyanobacterium SM2_1_0]|nr:YihY/virulence factor BrkB family protein [Spirulinaceae cyanobacterium SM2_1_0]